MREIGQGSSDSERFASRGGVAMPSPHRVSVTRCQSSPLSHVISAQVRGSHASTRSACNRQLGEEIWSSKSTGARERGAGASHVRVGTPAMLGWSGAARLAVP